MNKINDIITDATKIQKITLEFDDHYLIFEGDMAKKWLNAADSAALYSANNGEDYFKVVDFNKAYIKKK